MIPYVVAKERTSHIVVQYPKRDKPLSAFRSISIKTVSLPIQNCTSKTFVALRPEKNTEFSPIGEFNLRSKK
jgi:hypothetical protein